MWCRAAANSLGPCQPSRSRVPCVLTARFSLPASSLYAHFAGLPHDGPALGNPLYGASLHVLYLQLVQTILALPSVVFLAHISHGAGLCWHLSLEGTELSAAPAGPTPGALGVSPGWRVGAGERGRVEGGELILLAGPGGGKAIGRAGLALELEADGVEEG